MLKELLFRILILMLVTGIIGIPAGFVIALVFEFPWVFVGGIVLTVVALVIVFDGAMSPENPNEEYIEVD